MHAENLYSSEYFYRSRRYAQANYDRWLILSAQHGLIEPGTALSPYDKKLTMLSKFEQQLLARKVARQAAVLFENMSVRITSICGEEYEDLLAEAGIEFERKPEFALPIGKKLRALGDAVDSEKSQKLLDDAYKIVKRLITQTGLKCLKDVIESDMPASGVYLFFDEQERRLKDLSQWRIVRIGTHGVATGSRASLRNRMRTHFGTMAGDGNHRSSIFRLHTGRSMINAKAFADVASWGSPVVTKDALFDERALEQAVSKYLSKLYVALISVPGESDKKNDRAYLEQNLIALLSNRRRPLDPPNSSWLGLSSAKKEIRKSGLWNVNHVDQSVDPRFLEILNFYVSLTIGAKSAPSEQLAPKDWQARARDNAQQLALL